MPSIARGWNLTIVCGDSSLTPERITYQNTFAVNATGQHRKTYDISDALDNKAINAAIQPGSEVNGFLGFQVRKDNLDKLQDGCKLVLQFFDVTDRAYTVERIVKKDDSTMRYLPGTKLGSVH